MFTQAQLEEAWEQMKTERLADRAKAQLAADWLAKTIDADVSISPEKYHMAISPFKEKLSLSVLYGTYFGPSGFEKMPQISNYIHERRFFLDLSAEPGFNQDDKYYCVFDYFDHGNW